MSDETFATVPLKRSASNSSLADSNASAPKKTQESSKLVATDIINSIYGVAEIKSQFVVPDERNSDNRGPSATREYLDDEEGGNERLLENIGAEGSNGKGNKKGKKNNKRGQNKNRDNTQQKEEFMLCGKYKFGYGPDEENAPLCKYGAKCKYTHDLNEYLTKKLPDVSTEYFSVCPVFQELGYCPMGFKCKFLNTHLNSESNKLSFDVESIPKDYNGGEVNHIPLDNKFHLMKKRFEFTDTEFMMNIQDAFQQEYRDLHTKQDEAKREKQEDLENTSSDQSKEEEEDKNKKEEDPKVVAKREEQKKLYMEYKDARYWSREKKAPLNYNRKKVLSPLTTVGNLPYRRLMKHLGCDITFSEMALSLPLIQGTNSEWALTKSHKEETPGFGIQIASNKPWQAAKACEAIKKLLPNASRDVNEINLNCGCPIDLLYKTGAGSGLLDNPGRLIRCLNGMSYTSGDIPVTCKLRIGTKDDSPLAKNLVKRLVWETDVAAITLHGRTRQQRYTKASNWGYIKECARELRSVETDFFESMKDDETLNKRNEGTRIQFLGNGDLYYWKDWYDILDDCPEMDSIMVARGALIKPWIFEEIEAQQTLDKSSTERMDILSKYMKFAMDHWGTDEYGLLQSRRFFLEFMSFFHRYIPVGILERQNKLNERPPLFTGRDELETLMSSTNVNDWIKLSEMFLGKPPDSFQFTAKHKSNSFVQ